MTARDHARIEKSIAEIRRLITLQPAVFAMNEQKDAEIKAAIRPWLSWFEIEADEIEAALHGNPYRPR